MTTTGGPDQSIADPAEADQATGYPRVVRREVEPLDGDDITVEPDVARPHPRRRLLVGIVVAAILALAGAGIAVAANRHGSKAPRAATRVRSVAPASPAAAHPKHTGAVTKPKPRVVPKVPTRPPVNVAPAPTVAVPPVTTPVAATPPPPPPRTPPAEPASVLQWRTTPAALSVKGGARISFTVTVVNPTNGTVTLPTPLSCAPVLRGPKGATFGFGVCAQVAQLMAPHQTLSQRYTVYATDTGDASGNALKPGSYTANIENLYSAKVTITSS